MGASTPRFFDDRHRPWIRLLLAVLASALAHGALIFAARVGRVERPGPALHPLTVRLAQREQPAPPAAERQPVQVRAIGKPSRPEPNPAPMPQPAPPSPRAPAHVGEPPPAKPAGAEPARARPGMPEQAADATTLDMPLPEDTTYYPAREVDEHPVLVSSGRPVYPEQAARENVRGDVTVLMLLNENGVADEISIIDAKPAGEGFEEAVIAWLHDARFKPAMRKGRAVKARVVYHVTFDP